MNKHCYKVIFSKSRHCLVVVSELAQNSGKGERSISTSHQASLWDTVYQEIHRLSVGLLLGLGLVTLSIPAYAAISEDVHAPRNQQPMIVATASGVPQVNIQTPTSAGVSMNQYSQFDVEKKGAVLANNRQHTKTKIAGWVEANPFMSRGEADVIVNQVNSNDPSHLEGYVEVAGKKADIIVANPQGIRVNGAGFLNANKTVLSTGKTQIHNGKVTGHKVTQGAITVSGKGLDVRDSNYSALLARSVKVNAGIYKGEGQLDIVAGVNDIDVQGSVHKSTLSKSQGKQPEVAIDTSELGGMYAGSIRLIATEAGVGVNNAGQIHANTLTLDADGILRNGAEVVAQKSHINTKEVRNHGTIKAQEIKVKTNNLHNSGRITQTGPQNLTLKAKKLVNSARIEVAQKTADEAKPSDASQDTPVKNLTHGYIDVSNKLENAGDINSGGSIALDIEQSLSNSGSLAVEYAQLAHGTLSNSGKMVIRQANIQASELTNQDGTLHITRADAFNFTKHIRNSGSITIANGIDWNTQYVHNTGSVYSDNAIVIGAHKIENAGKIISNTTLSIRGTGALDKNTTDSKSFALLDNAGELTAQEYVLVKGGGLKLSNEQGTIGAQDVLIDVDSLTGFKNINARRDLGVYTQDDLNIDSDKSVERNLTIVSQGNVENSAVLSAGVSTRIESQKGIKNSGTLVSKSQTVFYGETLDNTGRINSQGLTYLHIKDTLDNQATGKIYGHSVVVNARTLTNHASSKSAGVIGGREQVVIGAQYIHNYDSNAKQKDPAQRAKSQALILSGGKLFIGGHINDKGELKGFAQSLVNKGGRIEVLGDADIAVKDIKNLNSHFATESRLDPKQTTHTLEYGELDSTERYIQGVDGELSEHDDNGKLTRIDTWLEFNFYPTKDPQTNTSYTRPRLKWSGYEVNRLHWWDYTTQVFRDEIVANNPAQMIVGGNLVMKGATLENNKSRIIVGGVLQDKGLKRIDNIDAKGTQSVVLEGTQGRYKFEDWSFTLLEGYQGDEIYKNKYDKPYAKTTMHQFDFTEDIGVYKDHVKADDSATFKTLKGLKLDVSLGGLFNVDASNPDVLIVTDADFIAQDEQSLNVDKNGALQIQAPYVPALLENDPSFKTDMHKRIGDSYYEQRLIQEQITQLTGRRFALGYYNDLEQYKALLDNGAQFAQQYNLKAGVALSAEQVARLTTDLVWLENQEVTLADGSTHMVSVPKVYLRARHTDVNTAGSIISAQRLDMSAKTVNNQGVLAGFKSNILKGENIDISGRVVGGSVGIAADKTLVVKGGTVRAKDSLFMKGDTVEIVSTTSDYGNTNGTTHGTIVDRIAGVYLTGNDMRDKATNNALVIQAQKDLTLKGATVRNDAQNTGSTQLVSEQGSVIMGTVGVTETEEYGTQDQENYRHMSIDKERGSTIDSNTDIFVQAKDTVAVRQGTINSTQGAVVLEGENGVTIQEGREKERITAKIYGEEYGLLSRTTRKQSFDVENDTSNGSSVTGEKVFISSGDNADVTIRGSNIISDHETSVHAGKDLVIEAAQNTFEQNNTSETKKVGIFGTGGLGFTIGGQKTTVQGQAQQTSHTSSVVGNLKEGKTILVAGRNYTQKGSTVNAVNGDVSIVAQDIDISSVHDTYAMDQEQEFAQGGLTVAASIPLVDSLISLVDTARNIGKSKNARVNAMALANTAYQGYETGMALKSLGEGLKAAKGIKDVAKAFNVGVSVTLGGEYKQNTLHKEAEQSVASLVQGKNTTLLATGGQHSDITITGSDVIGTQRTHIQADHDITLEADAQRSSEHSNNSSIGGGIGVSVGTQGFGIHANINGGLGYGVGNTLTHRNTTVGSLTGATTIEAGNALTLKGAQAQGKGIAVKANSLHVESLQDSAYYDSKQGNLGLGITVGAGVSGSVNVGFSKTNADHLSVSQQSGILAGDDGFNVNITDHTELTGGIISSTAKAEADGKNSFTTGTISTSDLDNHSDYKGMSFGMGVSAGITADIGLGKKAEPQGVKGKTGKKSLFVGKSAGFGHEKDRQRSTTQAGIGTRNITVSNTNTNTQQLTAAISTEDVIGGTGLENKFNAEELQKELDVQVTVSNKAAQYMPQVVAQIASSQTEKYEKAELVREALVQKLQNTTNPDEKAKLEVALDHVQSVMDQEQTKYAIWKEGGAGRVVLHGAVGGILTGDVSGVLGAGGSAALAPQIDKATENMSVGAKEGFDLVVGGVIGAVSGGGVAGAFTGSVVDWNNRQLHPRELDRIKALAQGDKEKEARLTVAACALVKCAEQIRRDDPTYAYVKAVQEKGLAKEYQSERELLAQQDVWFKKAVNVRGTHTVVFRDNLFDYTASDRMKDFGARHSVAERSWGLLQATGGVLEVVGAAGAVDSGFGAPAGAFLATNGADNFITGLHTVWDGRPHYTLGAQALSSATGMDPNTAELLYGGSTILVGTAGSVRSVVKNNPHVNSRGITLADDIGIDIAKTESRLDDGTKVVSKNYMPLCSGNACFVAGTLIHTIDGVKPIETIGIGELVWTREEFGEEYRYKPVIKTKVTENQAIYTVKVQHDTGLVETFNTTEEHPFWIDGQGWTKASVLESGMKLLDKHGNPTATIITQEKLDETDTVYNFEVQDFHTYHIGEVGLWVHNADCCYFTSAYGDAADKIKKGGWYNEQTKKVEYFDPFDGVRKEFPDDVGTLDHILPQKEFKDMINKDSRLNTEQKKELIKKFKEDPNNLQPLPQYLNSSKGAKVEVGSAGWEKYLKENKAIHPEYREFLKDRQQEVRQDIRDAIKEILNRDRE